jgi:AcrR family transcriptional regulator
MALPQSTPARNDRRNRIVLAASQMFAARAYVEVQMDDLAKAAEVAKPTIYRYFKSKEDLFLEALDGTMNDLVGEVSVVAAEIGTAPDVLRRMIGAALRSFARCTAAIRALDGTDAALGERGRAMLRRRGKQIREEFATVISRGVTEGSLRPLDADIVSRAVLGAVRMTSHADENPADGPGGEILIDLLLNGMTAAGRAKKG